MGRHSVDATSQTVPVSQRGVQDPSHVLDPERPYGHGTDPAGGNDLLEGEWAFGYSPKRRGQNADQFALGSTQRELQGPRGRGVRPLDVVDGDDQRVRLRQ